MRTISSSHYALGICAAAIILAGCGGATQFPNPVAQTSIGGAGTAFRVTSPSFATAERVGSDSSSSERLIGTVKRRCHKEADNINRRWFNASGKAAGPYPGTFTAKGQWWTQDVRGLDWRFHESFIIRSGTSTLSGTIGEGPEVGGHIPTCTKFENPEPYTSGSVTGNATINVRWGHFREDLLSF